MMIESFRVAYEPAVILYQCRSLGTGSEEPIYIGVYVVVYGREEEEGRG